MSRDTAFLDLMRAFFQDSLQLIYQIFLLYRTASQTAPNVNQVDLGKHLKDSFWTMFS